MTKRRSMLAVTLLSVIPIAMSVLVPASATAHGSAQNPPSRSYYCKFLDNVEAPKSAACKAAVAAGGTQAFYDWHEVNIGNAAGRHRQIIPDGQLCGAGRAKYQGLNLARADWPAATIPASGPFTWQIRATAAHVGTWELYVTRNGWNPAAPLKWSDLELFHTVKNPPLSGGVYQIATNLPAGKSGRHVVYTVWQRQLPDSAEAFYMCTDVIFGG
jgi:chitin-binding protein